LVSNLSFAGKKTQSRNANQLKKNTTQSEKRKMGEKSGHSMKKKNVRDFLRQKVDHHPKRGGESSRGNEAQRLLREKKKSGPGLKKNG